MIARLVAFAAALALSPAAFADEADAVGCARDAARLAILDGWRLRMIDTGALNQGEYVVYRLALVEGQPYRLLACGDGAVRDLDLYLYTPDGRLAKTDKKADAMPVLDFTPSVTGAWLLRTTMYAATGPANYSFALLYRPAPPLPPAE